MNRVIMLMVFITALHVLSCKKTVENAITPFSIYTDLATGANEIYDVFPLTDNTFVILTENRNSNRTKLYKFNAQLHLMDSIVITGQGFSKPVIEPDNTVLMLVINLDGNPGISAIKLDANLNVLQKRNIETLYAPTLGEIRYYNKLAKLANGNYVVGTTHEQYPVLKDKIVLFCVKDIFADNVPLWRVNPTTYTGEWLEEMHGDEYGNLYLGATDHLGASSNYLLKYDSLGNQIYKNYFPHTHENFSVFVEKDRVIYKDWWSFYTIDLQGNTTAQAPLGTFGRANSDLVKIGANYYYTTDTLNADGRFLVIRKTDANFSALKSKIFGNRGTHTKGFRRFFIQLSDGSLVAVALIENPDLSGNLWLLQKFNSDLEIDK